MTHELLPCPFCGGPADYTGGENIGYRVECQHCGAESGWGDYSYQVDAKWNTRTDATKDAEIARLEAENERMREALTDVVRQHDRYLDALGPEQAAMVSDPLSDACEAARAALSIPDPAGGMPVEVE